MPSALKAKKLPLAEWPLWKAIAFQGLMYGLFGALLVFFSSFPPPFVPSSVALFSGLLTLAGVAFALWSRQTSNWWARVGGLVIWSLLFLALGIRGWVAVLNGGWLVAVLLFVLVLFGLAWMLPAISGRLSARLWREQIAPQTRFGRGVMRWGVVLGLGGAGVIGASVGMSLVRTGGTSLAFLIVAIGMSGVAVFVAQGFSHQVWRDRPWAKDTRSRQVGEQL